jgi:hypothetical protein
MGEWMGHASQPEAPIIARSASDDAISIRADTEIASPLTLFVMTPRVAL